ncbi:hypothetical protein HSBAA_01930 [Vreelandella sulfidaeris]|uniref:Motility protein A N-terminal domain-containing protein n=1 Tax=Vreelandella sulfidaeris TaxID=115553 RepID=A0A455U062_9GAMM|nr:hypothetical protein HSBAA_01930 [Halomonas sulfidaeris]
MLIPLGYVIVLLSVFGGYVLAGGSLGPLYQPLELLIIGGAGVGAFIAANNGKAIKATFKNPYRGSNVLKNITKHSIWSLWRCSTSYCLKIRREGMLGIERDIDNPQESPLFQEHPTVLADPHIMNFLTDYLRLMVSGGMEPMEIDELMLHEIEVFEQEAHVPIDAIAKVGDAMPAFGIVAAVMGWLKHLHMLTLHPVRWVK